MDVTVAVCTWNRSWSLRRMLESVAAMHLPPKLDWEVLVANNNSTDDTDAVVDSFIGRLPIRRVLEPRQGVSHARNTATQEARGKYIVWTDDDTIVDVNWLVAYCAAFAQRPRAAVFGGFVRPKFDEPVPVWLERGWPAISAAFASVDFGPVPIPLSPEKVPYGANCALRRAELLQHRFDPPLGAAPGGRYYAEEVTVMAEMMANGAEGWWVPEARVLHCIPQERMTFAYLRTYYTRTGRTDYYLSWKNAPPTKKRFLGRPLWVWRNLIQRELRYWLLRPFLPKERLLRTMRDRYVSWGKFDEARKWSGSVTGR